MKTNFKSIVAGLVLTTTLLSACHPAEDSQTKNTVRVKASQSAAELAEAAEQLVGPYTFMLATKVADMALEKDATNLKAQFYKNFLARTEVFRGIQYRVKPLLTDSTLAEWARTKEAFPESPLKNFLYDESLPQLKNVADVQAVLGQYVKALGDFRSFLKKNQGSEMVINLNPHIFEEKIKKEAIKDCQVDESGARDFSVVCSTKAIAQVRLNSGDFVALTQYSAGEMLYFGLLNSYTMDGVDLLMDKQHTGYTTVQQKIDFLLSNRNFGNLKIDNAFVTLKEIGSDLSSAIKWVINYQSQLCPHGMESDIVSGSAIQKDQRRGYLFNSGICIKNSTETQNALGQLDKALAGVIAIEVVDSQHVTKSINLDAFAWSQSPIQDLRSIAPTAYSACGKIAAIKDNTLGGVLVDNNFSIFVDSNCK